MADVVRLTLGNALPPDWKMIFEANVAIAAFGLVLRTAD